MRKIGINAGAYAVQPMLDNIPYIRASGFDAVFTGWKNRETMAGWAERFAAAGLAYETVHAPFKFGEISMNDIWLPGEGGDHVLSTLLTTVEDCAAIGVPTVIIHLSSGEDAPPVTDAGRERFERLIMRAGEVGVALAFENQRKLSNLAFIFEQYGKLPQVGFCWDCGHESCFTPGREYMPLFGDHLIATHIHDNLGYGTGKNNDIHLVPFDGSMDFSRIARQIEASPFSGTLMLEVLSKKTDRYDACSPTEFFDHAAAAARRLAALCEDCKQKQD